jgi:hypothetical protein
MSLSMLQREATKLWNGATAAPQTDAKPAAPGNTAPSQTDGKGNAPMLDYAWEVFGNFADGVNDMVTGGDKKPGPANTGPGEKPRPKTVADYNTTLDKGLDSKIKGNRDDRAALDLMKKNGDAKAGNSETSLNGDRKALLADLKERSGVYNTDIKSLDAQLGTKAIKNPTPEQKALLDQKAALVKERDKYKDQQTSLQRWDDRNRINSINALVADPNLSKEEKAKLLGEKRTLATGLLSTTKNYQQFAEPWGETIYGKGRGYSTMREGGCGPTALANLLDFHDQEDPEGKASRGIKDYYNPRRVADYATNHGRVKGSGTSGDVMMNDLPQGFEGFQGANIGGMANARQSLENGVPVMMLGHNFRGQNNGSTVSPYKGHFVTLNGVSEDGSTYNVNDGGRNTGRNIQTMTQKQVQQGGDGFWNVRR